MDLAETSEYIGAIRGTLDGLDHNAGLDSTITQPETSFQTNSNQWRCWGSSPYQPMVNSPNCSFSSNGATYTTGAPASIQQRQTNPYTKHTAGRYNTQYPPLIQNQHQMFLAAESTFPPGNKEGVYVIPSSGSTSSGNSDQTTSSTRDQRNKRSKRSYYSAGQLTVLSSGFHEDKYPSRERREEIAKTLDLTPKQVKIWYQNYRAKHKRETKILQNHTKNNQYDCILNNQHTEPQN